ncbi:hypothetical protein EYZ11_005111 [Aspergillus tanneri]|uniref:Uncharacterized protein n=1 Tax=Aspergillus tanneri TaxID=1220188 RepID=A0A4V3UPK1_9EURO|nr:hypothetical protein EYZ11_005111 [Aspergillus tanneri]
MRGRTSTLKGQNPTADKISRNGFADNSVVVIIYNNDEHVVGLICYHGDRSVEQGNATTEIDFCRPGNTESACKL